MLLHFQFLISHFGKKLTSHSEKAKNKSGQTTCSLQHCPAKMPEDTLEVHTHCLCAASRGFYCRPCEHTRDLFHIVIWFEYHRTGGVSLGESYGNLKKIKGTSNKNTQMSANTRERLKPLSK